LFKTHLKIKFKVLDKSYSITHNNNNKFPVPFIIQRQQYKVKATNPNNKIIKTNKPSTKTINNSIKNRTQIIKQVSEERNKERKSL
jgi:hypothetical protein